MAKKRTLCLALLLLVVGTIAGYAAARRTSPAGTSDEPVVVRPTNDPPKREQLELRAKARERPDGQSSGAPSEPPRVNPSR